MVCSANVVKVFEGANCGRWNVVGKISGCVMEVQEIPLYLQVCDALFGLE